MIIPKATSIVLVALSTLTLLNFALKYYTYFVLMFSSSKNPDSSQMLVEETGEVPHPHELYVPFLTFIPTKSPVVTRPWVLITSSLIEENIIGFVLSFTIVYNLGKYFEPIWGTIEFIKFLSFQIVSTNAVLYIYYYLKTFIYTVNDVPPVVLSLMSFNIALIISLKQKSSNQYLTVKNLRIKVKYLPLLTISIMYLLSLISEEFYILYLVGVVGFLNGWFYIRFLKPGWNDRNMYLIPKNRQIVNINGDKSEQFAFHTFFPNPLSIPIKLFSNLGFKIFVKLGLLKESDFDLEDDSNEGVTDLLKNIHSWVNQKKQTINVSMERRRKNALNELD